MSSPPVLLASGWLTGIAAPLTSAVGQTVGARSVDSGHWELGLNRELPGIHARLGFGINNLEQERWDPGGRWEVDEARVMVYGSDT